MNIQKGGLYGGIVLAVVISVAIFLTVALDVEKTEREETRYEYVADITGLFGTDISPQYYDYDLAKSYTGYYTLDSQPYVGGIEYSVLRSGQANNYPLLLETEVVYDSDYDLSRTNVPNAVDHLSVGIYGPEGTRNNTETLMNEVNNKSLKAFLMETNLAGDTVTFKLASDTRENWILFGSTYEFVNTGNGNRTIYYALPEYRGAYPTWSAGTVSNSPTLQIALSCKVLKGTETVELYSTPDASGIPFKIVSLDYAVVMYGGTSAGASSDYPYLMEATTIHITSTNPVSASYYLDISKGVRVSTEE